jgi:EAL domain-containing protein (putative c-di-GMP-specific phosphodiesterase class I)
LAEGVETEQQLEFLRANHCDELQGFYFGMPMSVAEFGDVLRTNDTLRAPLPSPKRAQLSLL